MIERTKVIGIGLNKTGTKSLRTALEQWGYNHCYEYERAFKAHLAGRDDDVIDIMRRYDSFEDWPWPLLVDKIDSAFPDAKIVLTTRATPEAWYRSLCRMAVRMGPLDKYEVHIYGSSMPQGDKQGHLRYYEQHNQAMRERFAQQRNRFLDLCWDDADAMIKLADFLGHPPLPETPHANRGRRVYGGDNLLVANAARVGLATLRRIRRG